MSSGQTYSTGRRQCHTEKRTATRMGFEPTRAEPNGLAVHRLNHSATSSCQGPTAQRSHTTWGHTDRPAGMHSCIHACVRSEGLHGFMQSLWLPSQAQLLVNVADTSPTVMTITLYIQDRPIPMHWQRVHQCSVLIAYISLSTHWFTRLLGSRSGWGCMEHALPGPVCPCASTETHVCMYSYEDPAVDIARISTHPWKWLHVCSFANMSAGITIAK